IETSARPWNVERGKPRRAGVSSFGIGGTNAHVVLEEAPGLEVPAADASGEYDAASEILPLSAKSPSALIRACRRLADHLEAQPKSSLAAV
ncbi:ketoacyl-synthetase C-terminal extension domain-containing protein, partial [Streptococcus suis]|uniref:ketoacyl-synthetase C-terminal extension domain-containing protein n=1 Tax=Streptococcus suis TaxID=1307 RepID=UPI00370A49B2